MSHQFQHTCQSLCGRPRQPLSKQIQCPDLVILCQLLH